MAELQPHKSRYWLNADPKDPVEFDRQVREVCATYRAAPERLSQAGIHTVCVDEKTGIQALERIAPTKPMRPGQVEKREFEYERHGTQCLIGNFEVATGRVIAPTVQETRNEADFARHIPDVVACGRGGGGRASSQQRQRSQRAHERAIIDGSADGIAVLDGAGLVRQWNPAAHRLTGVAADDAMGKAPPFPQPEPGAKLTHRLPAGRWLDVLCTALAGTDERVIDFRDVTAAKELEEAKDLFMATTSHELRTPITVVQGFASTLAQRWDQLTDADRRAAVQTIAERVENDAVYERIRAVGVDYCQGYHFGGLKPLLSLA